MLYKRIKINNINMLYIYVLLLEENKYYIGKTENPYKRFT